MQSSSPLRNLNPNTLGMPVEVCKEIFSHLPTEDLAQLTVVNTEISKIAQELLSKRPESTTKVATAEMKERRFYSRRTEKEVDNIKNSKYAQEPHSFSSSRLPSDSEERHRELLLHSKARCLYELKEAIQNKDFKLAETSLAELEKIDKELQSWGEYFYNGIAAGMLFLLKKAGIVH